MSPDAAPLGFGSSDLRLPDALRGPLREHLAELRQKYLARNWAGRVGFGARPALIVIDLAPHWTMPQESMGSNLDPVVNACCRQEALSCGTRHMLGLPGGGTGNCCCAP